MCVIYLSSPHVASRLVRLQLNIQSSTDNIESILNSNQSEVQYSVHGQEDTYNVNILTTCDQPTPWIDVISHWI